MNSRRKTLGKILHHRHRALEERAAALAQRREAQRQAEVAEEREREALARAAEHLQRMSQAVMTAADWGEAQSWLEARADEHHRARQGVARADAIVRHAQHEMVAAHHDVKRIELLDERLARSERRAFEVAEQKSNDELVTLRFAEQRRATASH